VGQHPIDDTDYIGVVYIYRGASRSLVTTPSQVHADNVCGYHNVIAVYVLLPLLVTEPFPTCVCIQLWVNPINYIVPIMSTFSSALVYLSVELYRLYMDEAPFPYLVILLMVVLTLITMATQIL